MPKPGAHKARPYAISPVFGYIFIRFGSNTPELAPAWM